MKMIRKNEEENSKVRESPRENRLPVRGRSCERFGRSAFEDHLGVALIQPGGSRYEQMKVAVNTGDRMATATRVEPRS